MELLGVLARSMPLILIYVMIGIIIAYWSSIKKKNILLYLWSKGKK